MNQHEFAEKIGMKYRTYQDRIHGKKEDWRLSELIALSELGKSVEEDDGIVVTANGKTYCVTLREVL